jgi:hypothetical protein
MEKVKKTEMIKAQLKKRILEISINSSALKIYKNDKEIINIEWEVQLSFILMPPINEMMLAVNKYMVLRE